MISTSTGAYLSTAGVWQDVSDVNRKHLFTPISGDALLAKIRDLSITEWSYKVEDKSVRHLGPTAQDFKAAFNLGSDEKTIGMVDADGVALAGVKALDARTMSQEQRIKSLEQENADLKRRLEKLEAALDSSHLKTP